MKRTGSGFYVCADTERKTLRLHDMLPTRLRAASRDLLEQADGKNEERIVDFLSGAIYSQKGNIQKIANHIYAISPEDVGLFEG